MAYDSQTVPIQFDRKLADHKDIRFSQGNLALSMESYAMLLMSKGDLNNRPSNYARIAGHVR